MPRSLVTVATDGFRDYVELPDGRTLNLGSVSVLKLVTSLVQSPALCKRALDSFLKSSRALVQVELEELEQLLKPKRARWAHFGNGLISNLPRQGESMTEQAQPTNFKASFDAASAAFEALSRTPSPETLETFVRQASALIALATEEEPKADQSGGDQGQQKDASVETPSEEGVVKLATEEVPLINEGLVHLVVAKVEAAVKAVEASKKKGTDVAKGDLHVISTRLDGIAKTANFQDPTLRTALLDLARKADKVRAFFG